MHLIYQLNLYGIPVYEPNETLHTMQKNQNMFTSEKYEPNNIVYYIQPPFVTTLCHRISSDFINVDRENIISTFGTTSQRSGSEQDAVCN